MLVCLEIAVRAWHCLRHKPDEGIRRSDEEHRGRGLPAVESRAHVLLGAQLHVRAGEEVLQRQWRHPPRTPQLHMSANGRWTWSNIIVSAIKGSETIIYVRESGCQMTPISAWLTASGSPVPTPLTQQTVLGWLGFCTMAQSMTAIPQRWRRAITLSTIASMVWGIGSVLI